MIVLGRGGFDPPVLRDFTEKCSLFLQITMETANPANKQSDTGCEHAQLKKLDKLEQEYLQLTSTQKEAEVHTEMHVG